MNNYFHYLISLRMKSLYRNFKIKEFSLLFLGLCFLICGASAIKWLNLFVFIAYVPLLLFLSKSVSKYRFSFVYLVLLLSNLVSLFWMKATMPYFHYFLLCLILASIFMLPFYAYRKKKVLKAVYYL